jgi:hypothetical protein
MLEDDAISALEILLPALERHNVDCLAIGGLAVAHYGHRRVSGGPVKGEIKVDIDFWYNPTQGNFVNLIKALKDVDIDVDDIEQRVFDPKKSYLKIPHKTFHMDFLPQLEGLDSYRNSKRNSTIMHVGKHQLAVLGFEDLLKNKRAVGRAVDAADIAALERKRRGIVE